MSTSASSATVFSGRLFIVAFGVLALAVSTGCKMAADGQNLQGVRFYQQGQYDAAMQRFQQAVAADPKNPDAYYNMAATVHRMGTARSDQTLLNQAETLYNRCLDEEKDHADCHRGLAVLLAETGRSDRAFNLLRNWAVRSPKVADARIELARLHEEFGEPDTAKVHLTEALKIDQHNARAWTALGRLREQSGEYAQALANYDQSYRLNRFQPQVAERIAALNHTLSGGGIPTRPGGTRMVDSSSSATR
ncbi:MAG: tetratricopeptide repeat protein [Planctomycetes bacterium]|nr:tetratricopeptide repeat protein [Planctomycetota bacterium]MBL7044705.1 tetratricopeptide repeat protein [Pirellulaceae bacterium]